MNSFDELVDELAVDVRRRDGSISFYRFVPDASLSALDVGALLSSLDAPSLHEAREQFVVAGTALVRRVRLLQAIGRRWPLLGYPVLGPFARHSDAMRQCQLFLGGAIAVTAAVAVLPPGWQTPGRSCDHGALCWAIDALGLVYVVLAAALLLVEAALLALYALGGGGAGGGAGGAGGAGRRLGLLLPALRQAVLMLVAVAALAAHPYLFALLAIDVVPSLPGCRALLRPLLLRLPALAALGTLAAAALLAAAAVGATLPAGSGCMGDGGAGYAKGQYSVAGCAAEAIVLGLPAAVAAPLLAASLPQPRPYLTMPEAEAGGEAEGGGGGGGGEGGGGGWLGAPLLLLLLCVAVLLLQACTRRAPAPCTRHAPAGCCRHAPTMHPYAPAMHLLRACHARSRPSSCSKLTGPRLTTLTAGRARPRARQPCGAAGGARRGAARPGAQLPRVRPVAPRAAPTRRTRLRAARRGRAQPHGIPAAARPRAGAPRATGAAAARRRPRRGAGWRGARGRRAGGRGRCVAGRVRAARCGGLLPRLR